MCSHPFHEVTPVFGTTRTNRLCLICGATLTAGHSEWREGPMEFKPLWGLLKRYFNIDQSEVAVTASGELHCGDK